MAVQITWVLAAAAVLWRWRRRGSNFGGGGGGSFNSGSNQVNESGVNEGHGSVTIALISAQRPITMKSRFLRVLIILAIAAQAQTTCVDPSHATSRNWGVRVFGRQRDARVTEGCAITGACNSTRRPTSTTAAASSPLAWGARMRRRATTIRRRCTSTCRASTLWIAMGCAGAIGLRTSVGIVIRRL